MQTTSRVVLSDVAKSGLLSVCVFCKSVTYCIDNLKEALYGLPPDAMEVTQRNLLTHDFDTATVDINKWFTHMIRCVQQQRAFDDARKQTTTQNAIILRDHGHIIKAIDILIEVCSNACPIDDIWAKSSYSWTDFFLMKISCFCPILTKTPWSCISKQEKVIPERPVLAYGGNFCFARYFFLLWVRENLRKGKMCGKNNYYSKNFVIFWNFLVLGEILPKNPFLSPGSRKAPM